MGSFAQATAPRGFEERPAAKACGRAHAGSVDGPMSHAFGPMGASGAWGGGNAAIEAAEAAASAKFAFAFASPTTTTWLPTHQAFGQWSKGGLGKARLR
jgi:hypothetical protein